MSSAAHVFGLSMPLWAAVIAVFAGWLAIGWVLKEVLFKALERLAGKTQTQIDDMLIHALNLPINIGICVTGGLMLYGLFVPDAHDARYVRYVGLIIKSSAIVAAVLFINRFVVELIQNYSDRVAVLRASQGFASSFSRIVILGIGALVLLDTLGFSVAPIIASLGIGSLAVALALQPTLENVFSGLQIIVDQPLVPGQFVKLESGEEGYVEKVGWRSTWIRQLPNNMVIVPNKQIVNSRLLNYYYPSKELAVLVEMGVHYSSDLNRVERVATEVAREVLKRVPGGVADFEPFIRFHTFSDSSINFSVIMRGREFVDNYTIKHEFIKAIAARFTKEGIVIPYPVRAINTEQEKAVMVTNGSPNKS